MTEQSGKKILTVDDDPDNLDLLRRILGKEGYEVITVSNGYDALKQVKKSFFKVIILDIRMPGMDGIEVLKALQKESPQSQVMILSAYCNDDNVKKAYQLGVFDILEKPVNKEWLLLKVKKAFQVAEALLKEAQIDTSLPDSPYKNIIGNSSAIKGVFNKIKKVAPSNECVLITGEMGTGKELVARAIHQHSNRAGGFIAVNTVTLPDNLLANELFGHEEEAFTDARSRKFGLFETAHNGTLFLDEIGDISPHTQASLLRVLQEKKIKRIGGAEMIDVNARVVTATNQDLEKLMEEKAFREDLFYRIEVFTIQLPPLRERKEDIPLLIEHFIKTHSEANKELTGEVLLSDGAANLLMDYHFPGNIRELETIIKRGLAFQEGNIIQPEDILPKLKGRGKNSPLAELFKHSLGEAKNRFEKMYIEARLRETGGNIKQAAEISEYDRSGFQKKMKEFGLSREDFQG